MGIAERRERERQELRLKILDAARELFAERGYQAVTMREIANRIEYSATALYKHFVDKEALVRELCHHDFKALAGLFIQAVSNSSGPYERFIRVGLVYLDFAVRHPQHYQMMFMGGLPPVPPNDQERDDPTQNAYVSLRALTADLVRAGLVRAELADVDLAVQTVWAIVHGAAALELTLSKNGLWLDFRPRRERFTAALEAVARSIARDPEDALARLRRVLADDADKPWGLGPVSAAQDKGG
ncbi:MAG TPA: TetR/AcrR family transcriptional regulator [Polyangiaceae bacterium]|nr:TetR/AcrR family transcriptional regulator [Polyangiaceae bacterium]